MSNQISVLKSIAKNVVLCLLLCASALVASAQSGEINAPSPVRKSDLMGRIAARDLGDSRFTNHYYAFTGTPGDLLLTIQSRNLNGDVDVFTAGTLRPLLKLTLYAESSAPVTKGIYLRRREDLILRIEARSPNDDEGTYQILFSGSFQPIAGGLDIAENETPTTGTPTTTRQGKRVNSVGARIDEPAPPVTDAVVAPTPNPTPVATPAESPAPKTSAKKTTSTTPPASARTRRPAGRRSTASAPKPTPTPSVDETAKQSEETKPTEEPRQTSAEPAVATTPKTKPPRRTNTVRSGTTARPVKPAPATPAEPEPEVGPRLVIETNDGTLINRSMSTVKRVTVENGWVVVTGKDGKIDRMLLVNVTRMTIQPQ